MIGNQSTAIAKVRRLNLKNGNSTGRANMPWAMWFPCVSAKAAKAVVGIRPEKWAWQQKVDAYTSRTVRGTFAADQHDYA